MSRSLRSYPVSERLAVAMRRAKSKTKGLGYWAALDAIKKLASRKEKD